MKEPNSRMARMIIKLSEYDFEIKHKKGKTNIVPDYLSRIEINTINTTENFSKEQLKDDFCKKIISILNNKFEKIPKKELPKYKRISRRYKLDENNTLHLKNPRHNLIVIPSHLKDQIIAAYHDKAIGGGHFGIRKTIEKL